MTLLVFESPTREDLFNWGAENPLHVTAHPGLLPIAQGTEPIETLLGVTWRTYMEYAECTVYVDISGFLQIEFYREGDGLYPGNPENGEEILVYWMQCADVMLAQGQARIALDNTDGILSADYFIGLGYQQEKI